MSLPPRWAGRGPRARPPWWPEGERWPPSGPRRWAHGRRPRGRWRGLLFLAVVVFVAVAVVNTVLGLFGYLLLPATIEGKLLAAGLGVLMIGFLAVNARVLARAAQRASDAAARVEAGDYSARLSESALPPLGNLYRAFNSMSARLEAREARRRSFLAEVTHELRTPLAIIRGEAEAISDGVHRADAESLGRILDAARAIELLVDDVGTLSVSATGALVLKREPTDLAVLVNESLDSFRRAAEAAGVTLVEEVDEGLAPVSLDPARIGRVLGNLLTNAIRHTPAGGRVTVAARSEALGIAISVADSGDGIAPELLDHVFERFVKDPSSPGSGLGLAIARDVVAAHLGSIQAESVAGAGTVVRIWLPA